MSSIALPLELAAISTAIVWPLALGATVVLWTKARAADRRRRLAAIEGGLKGMFRTVAQQPVPERLELVVDALGEQEAMAAQIARGGPHRRPAPAS